MVNPTAPNGSTNPPALSELVVRRRREGSGGDESTCMSSITQLPAERYHGVNFYPSAHLVQQMVDAEENGEGHRQLEHMRGAMQRAAPRETSGATRGNLQQQGAEENADAEEPMKPTLDDGDGTVCTATTANSSRWGETSLSGTDSKSATEDDESFNRVVAALQARGALPVQEDAQTETDVDQVLADFQNQLDLLGQPLKDDDHKELAGEIEIPVATTEVDACHNSGLEPWPEEASVNLHEEEYQQESEQDRLLLDALIKAKEQPNPVTPSKPIDLVNGDPVLIDRYRRVESVWIHMNAHHPEEIKALCTEDFLAHVMGPDRQVQMKLTLAEIQANSIFQAFPNFKFMYRSIQESLAEPGVIVVHDFVGTGAHTGDPFGFGPFPPIEPTGKVVVLDPSESHYHFDPETNLIYKEEIIALGEITGPPGVYVQLGGTMGPPPAP